MEEGCRTVFKDASSPGAMTTLPEGSDAASRAQSPARSEGGLYCMGSMFSVVAYAADSNCLDSAITGALAEAKRLDELLSNYRSESELSRVNRLASQSPVPVSTEFLHFLSACLAYSRASEGAFDITVGALMKASGFFQQAGRLPGPEQIRLALGKTGYRKVIVDEGSMTVRFAEEGLELDPGGIGKGFAVDNMADILRRNRVHSALISAGGSTIYALGAPPGQPGWKVNIKDPRKPSSVIETVRLKDEAISTTGTTEKFFWDEGNIWGHILDPRTGYSSMDTLAVSVIAPQAVDSEAWTKPYFILGRVWTAKHKPQNFRVFYCEEKSNSDGLWL
jgi:thiamine biosynthesis lipoprotein